MTDYQSLREDYDRHLCKKAENIQNNYILDVNTGSLVEIAYYLKEIAVNLRVLTSVIQDRD